MVEGLPRHAETLEYFSGDRNMSMPVASRHFHSVRASIKTMRLVIQHIFK